jgi:hypothetical protein
MRDYNRICALKKELSTLNFQKYAINEFCSGHSKAMMALLYLQSHGVTEDQIIHVNNFLEENGKDMKSSS